ncbi:MAG TPA: GTP cyclohydrolase I FolE [Anaerolineales bacterium]|nr:GTP cyclohydrolase I FolE [Anaerolineales bacterium]
METNHTHAQRDSHSVIAVEKRQIPADQIHKFEGYMSEIFSALGMDMETPSTVDTPKRYIQALIEATDGFDGDPKLLKTFRTECRGEPDCRISQLIEGPIRFHSLCEHHVFPFFGRAYIGYIAHEHIIGLSKLTRLVRLFTHRFAVQERIGQQVADSLEAMLEPHGVAVYLEAQHMCVEMRGVREAAPLTRTLVWRGNYASDASLRSEFLAACGLKN